jgi:hypothetical protein
LVDPSYERRTIWPTMSVYGVPEPYPNRPESSHPVPARTVPTRLSVCRRSCAGQNGPVVVASAPSGAPALARSRALTE